MLADLQYHDRVDAGRAAPARPRGRRRAAGGHPRPHAAARARRRGPRALRAATRCSPRSCCPRGWTRTRGELPARLADALRVRLRRVPEPVRRLLPSAAAIGRPAAAALLGAASGDGGARALGRAARGGRPPPARRAPARRSRSATTSCARPSTPTCCPASGRRCTRRSPRRSAPAASPPSWPCTGAPRAAARRRCARRSPPGYEAEGARAFAEALRHFRRRAGPRAAEDAIDLLGHASDMAKYTGDYDQAVAWCEEALAALDGTGDAARAARFFERLGRLQSFAGDSGHAAFQEALRLLPDEDRVGRARLLGAEGYALWTVQGARRGAASAARRRSAWPSRSAPGRRPRTRAWCSASSSPTPATRQAARRTCARRSSTSAGSIAPTTCSTRTSTWPRCCGCCGRFDDALEVTEEGERARAAARDGGLASGASSPSTPPPTSSCSAAGIAPRCGSRASAPTDLEPWNAIARGQVAGQLHLARGRLEDAARELEAARGCCDGAPAECGPAVYAGLAEIAAVARQARRRAGAGATAGWSSCAASEDLLYAPALYAMGARVEAEAASRATRRRDRTRAAEAARAAARRARRRCSRASSRRRRRSPTARRRGPRSRAPPGRTPRPSGRARRRVGRRVGAPYPAAYARWRQAEAVLRGGRRRGPRRPRRCGPRTPRPASSARRSCAAEIEGLARRARVDVGAGGRPRPRRRSPSSGSPRASSRCSRWWARG